MWLSVWVFVCGGGVRGQFTWVSSLLVGVSGIYLMSLVIAVSSQHPYALAELWEPLSFLFYPHACDKSWLPQISCFHFNCKISEGMKGRRICNEYPWLVTSALSSSQSGDILFPPCQWRKASEKTCGYCLSVGQHGHSWLRVNPKDAVRLLCWKAIGYFESPRMWADILGRTFCIVTNLCKSPGTVFKTHLDSGQLWLFPWTHHVPVNHIQPWKL